MTNDKRQEIIKSLEGLGISQSDIQIIVSSIENEDNETARLFLRRHRVLLMDSLHESQKKVDDLDFLVYQLDKDKIFSSIWM